MMMQAKTRALLYTLLFSPLSFFVAVVASTLSSLTHYLFPLTGMMLALGIFYALMPALYMVGAITSIVLGFVFLARSIYDYLYCIDFNNKGVNLFLYDGWIRSLLLIFLGIIACGVQPLSFMIITNIFQLVIFSCFLMYYFPKCIKQLYEFFFIEETNIDLKPESSYSKMANQFDEHYNQLLEQIPSRLKNLVEDENIQRGFNGPISTTLMWDPVHVNGDVTTLNDPHIKQRSYERSMIIYSLLKTGWFDPTNHVMYKNEEKKLKPSTLIANDKLRNKINVHIKQLKLWVNEHAHQDNEQINTKAFLDFVYPK
jgi:hypothetical protein